MDRKAYSVALGGMLAAVAVVLFCLASLIPVATYLCPMLAIGILELVRRVCGTRIGWAWYAAVAILCTLFSADREAAILFVFLGFYPLVKGRLDRLPARWLWKLVLFNLDIAAAYFLMLRVFGLDQLAAEFAELGWALGIAALLMGNLCFILLDRLLSRPFGRARHG
ncbi:MAG: hypothetical protein LUH51_02225 [Firmicutes bacterium]|nr:hypothetical protein [Bacillota bacterium]